VSRPNELFGPLLTHLSRIQCTRGNVFLILYVKSLRSATLNYLSGNRSKIEGIATTKDGIPIILGDLIPVIRESDSPEHGNVLPFLSTILHSTRTLKTGTSADVTTVTQPASVLVPSDIDKYAKDF